MRTHKALLLTAAATLILGNSLLAGAQPMPVAPKIMGMSAQGSMVNLDFFKGKKNVLVVFYRTHS